MMSRPARVAMIVLGVLAVLVGVIWIGQRLGLIPGSVMTGDRTWFYIGIGVAVVGIVLVASALRRPRPR